MKQGHELMHKLIAMVLAVFLTGCAQMVPHSKPVASYDEFKKTWTVTSTRWGTDGTNIGPNPSFIRAFVYPDGNVSSHIYSRIKTQNFMYPEYALDGNGTKYDAKQIASEVICSTPNVCNWYQDVIIAIDYTVIADMVEKNGNFKLRVYGRTPPQDVAVLACQFWEVTKEIFTIKKIDAGEKASQMGPSCSS
jgi:hypothetical protein